jgi:hypothetical protein
MVGTLAAKSGTKDDLTELAGSGDSFVMQRRAIGSGVCATAERHSDWGRKSVPDERREGGLVQILAIEFVDREIR